MRKNRAIVLAVTITLLAVAWTQCGLTAPESLLERRLLALTPAGTPKATVRATLQRRGFTLIEDTSLRGYEHLAYPVRGVTGDSFVRVRLWVYPVPMAHTTVVGFYFFDRDERLTAIRLRKDVDSF